MADRVLILSGELTVPPAGLAGFREAARAMAAGSRAEPGCHAFDITESLTAPGGFRVFEIFADRAALEAHRATPHYAAFVTSLRALGVTGEVRRFEATEIPR